MSNKEYTANEVADALEGFTWPFTYQTWDYDTIDGRYQRVPGSERTVHATGEFSWSEAEEVNGKDVPGIGVVEIVELDSGGEGHGEDIHVVIKTVETGQYFRKNGSYYSHYGEEWEGRLHVVNAMERTVVFYE